jgi:hypothetical protein
MSLLLGGIALVITLADTARLFARSADHSFVSLLVWGLWAIGLFAPLAWAVRDRARASNYVALGYVMAILAIGVMETIGR